MQLIKEAAQHLSRAKGTFTRQDIADWIRQNHPDLPLNLGSLNPQIQGVTVNLRGGAPGAVGKTILTSVGRGQFRLYREDVAASAEEVRAAPVPTDSRPPVTEGARAFETRARSVMSVYFAVPLTEREIPPTKRWDMVSFDQRIVGDAKFYTFAGVAAAEHSAIAEHVWLLEKLDAEKKFLVFGGRREISEGWLRRWQSLLPENIQFFWLPENGDQPETM